MTHKGKRFILTRDPGGGGGSVEAQDGTVTLDEGLVPNQFMAGNRNVKIQGHLSF